MQLKRVVVTGLGAVSPLGRGMESLMAGLYAGTSGVTGFPAGDIKGMRSAVAALVPEIDQKEIPRKFRRSMSSMSVFATLAAREAVAHAGLDEAACSGGRIGVAIGSTVGSPATMEAFFRDYLRDESLERLKSTLFFHIMNHSCAANVAQALGITGRILAPAAACSTGCQAVGYGAEMIAFGKQEIMLCGGADEFHPLTAGTFDIMNAASTGYNDVPGETPRPFDRDRDGIVCGEGSGILVLESLDSALQRGAPILAEVVGFATLSDPASIANPDPDSIERCMRLALREAEMSPEEIGYVNAHATATELGDIAESEAISRVFGPAVPVSSLKGHLGHTMAASGSIELAASIEMMRREVLVPTLHLQNVDPRCSAVRHVTAPEQARVGAFLKNNFALGGVNSSIIIRRFSK